MQRLWRTLMGRLVARPPAERPLRELANGFLTAPVSLNEDSPRAALVLLNTPPRPASALRTLWALSSYRVCADAAANRLRGSIQLAMGDEEAMVSGSPAALRERLVRLRHVAKMHESMVPDAVTGDFDSIDPEVLEFYEKRKLSNWRGTRVPIPCVFIPHTLLHSRVR
jgi:hypothetical protein